MERVRVNSADLKFLREKCGGDGEKPILYVYGGASATYVDTSTQYIYRDEQITSKATKDETLDWFVNGGLLKVVSDDDDMFYYINPIAITPHGNYAQMSLFFMGSNISLYSSEYTGE